MVDISNSTNDDPIRSLDPLGLGSKNLEEPFVSNF